MATQTAGPKPTRHPVFPNVTVILGDPKLPDTSKINNRFGPTDFEAIRRLKAALQELADYRFTYLDNHATLLSDLLANPPSFVLNLCDTGYKNEALRELHAPALLEMLGIPYSGAGPTCLGVCYDKALVRAVASRERVRDIVQLHTHPIPSPRFQRFRMLMADTVGEIEQSVADSARSATGGDVVEPHRDQRGGPANSQFQRHNRRTQYLQAFTERAAVEEERLAVILALVLRHFAPRSKMAPIAAAESCGLW